MIRAQVVATGLRWLDTPWHHQGRVRGIGVDCIGLIAMVAVECGIKEGQQFLSDPICQGYGRQPDPAMLLAACDRYLDRVAGVEAAHLGDILVFRIEREAQHFGLVTSTAPLMILHALEKIGRVRTHRVDALWRARVVRVYAYRGID